MLYVQKITVADVARALGKSEQFIRLGLRENIFPFGTALKMKGSSRFCYVIYPEKFREFINNGTF